MASSDIQLLRDVHVTGYFNNRREDLYYKLILKLIYSFTSIIQKGMSGANGEHARVQVPARISSRNHVRATIPT